MSKKIFLFLVGLYSGFLLSNTTDQVKKTLMSMLITELVREKQIDQTIAKTIKEAGLLELNSYLENNNFSVDIIENKCYIFKTNPIKRCFLSTLKRFPYKNLTIKIPQTALPIAQLIISPPICKQGHYST